MIPSAILHAIQLAVAPIFMLAAVAAMIGTVATRLARIIDRARELEERLESGAARNPDADHWELNRLKLRGRICNGSVASILSRVFRMARTWIFCGVQPEGSWSE